MLPLRPYQQDAINAINAADVRRPLVVHPTGSGKTVTFAHLLKQRAGRGLVLCHRDELIRQTVNKLNIIAPELSTGVIKAQEHDVDADVIVASIPTLARRELNIPFQMVIVDEAHHANASTWSNLIQSFDCLTVGFTATAERGDGQPLSTMWDEIVHRISLIDLIVQGYLCDVYGQLVGVDADFTTVPTRQGDYSPIDLARSLLGNSLEQVADGYVKYASDRKGIAYTPSVTTAFELADNLNERGIKSEAIYGSMEISERRWILESLKSDRIQVVVNCNILTEGFDEPSVSCICIARPTKSKPLFQQMIGRGLRTHPSKDDCLVLDTVGCTNDHSLITLAMLAGVPKLRGSLAQTILEDVKAHRRSGVELYSGVSTTVDLFRSRLKWLPVTHNGIEAYVLPGKDILIAPLADGWIVSETEKGRTPTVLHRGLSLSYAQGYGEDLSPSLAKKSSRWNKDVPSDAQKRQLRIMGMGSVIDKISTRGEASDLITRIYARTALKKLVKIKVHG